MPTLLFIKLEFAFSQTWGCFFKKNFGIVSLVYSMIFPQELPNLTLSTFSVSFWALYVL